MKKLLQAPGIFAVVCLMLPACSPQKDRGSTSATDGTARTKEVVAKLKDGDLIERLNDRLKHPDFKNQTGDGSKPNLPVDNGAEGVTQDGASADRSMVRTPVTGPSGGGDKDGVVPIVPDAPVASAPVLPAPPVIEDPCPSVAKPAAGAPHEEMLASLKGFAKCLMDVYHPAEILSSVVSHLTVMKVTLPAGTQPLSERTIEELDEFVKSTSLVRDEVRSQLGVGFTRREELRTSFSDAELQEIVALVRRRTNRLREVEKKVFAAVDARIDMVKYFGTGENKINRYAALLALRETATDRLGAKTIRTLDKAFRECKTPFAVPGELSVPPAMLGLGLIHPYALTAILPDPDKETAELHPELENPFERVKAAIGELAGPPALVDNAIYSYGLKRDLPLFAQPEHPPAAADAVRVAFVDTGIDFKAEADLGEFLGDGTQGQLSSEDMGGVRGHNAWGPIGLPEFSHGSLTTASLLTLVASLAPEILEQRKLDLAMWKMRSDAILLTGPVSKTAAFTPQLAMKHDFIRKMEADEVKPKIVSISMSMGLWPYMEKAGKQDLVKNAPWLWIMSSGNEGRTLDTPWTLEGGNDVLCLEDIPVEHRDDSKILCVGALVQGIVTPKIAEYSNYGKRVDVYAFESYTKLCPNGTSCAAPAVTAAATIIAHRFPTLTPAQIKQVIVETAEERELAVGLSDASSPTARNSSRLGTKMKVKVFNPLGMMDKALKNAAVTAGLVEALKH